MRNISHWLAGVKRRFPFLYQLAGFCIVGSSGLAIMLAGYYLCLWLGVQVQIANLVGYFLSTVYSYLLDFVFVFDSKGKPDKGSAAKFFFLYLVLYFYSAFLVYLLVDVCHINKLIVPILNAMLMTPPSFLASKYWVFPQHGKKSGR